jgi:hypothetical protein
MATVADLPASAKILYGPGGQISGQVFAQCGADLTWSVPDVDVQQFLTVVGGGVSGGQGSTQWVIPLRHPSFTQLYAKSISGKTLGYDTVRKYFAMWAITVHFETPPYATNGPDAFLTIQGRPGGRAMALPASGGTLADGSRTAHDPGQWVPGFTYDVTVHQLPYLNEGGWLGFIRCVNSTTFRNCPPGTVLYSGPAFNRTTTFSGVTTYEVTHSFEVSAVDWNSEYGMDGSLQEWTSAGNTRYPKVDLNQLLQNF